MLNGWKIPGVFTSLLMVVPLAGQIHRIRPVGAGSEGSVGKLRGSWKVLAPVTRRNLSLYPVVSDFKIDASHFLSLDEGLAIGQVQIKERGQWDEVLYRRRDPRPPVLGSRREEFEGARVNELMLVNESSRPLILLAGEVVSGGKQNRIIGADLIVPPNSDPLPLEVFCVEHGRWSSGGGAFGSAKAIAHPSIREEAQVGKSQSGVWESVARSAARLEVASPTGSYVDVLNSPEAKSQFDETARSIEGEYERELRKQLQGGGAVGVVVAINGRLVWADVFPSADLFQKYWPKLLRSYMLEAQAGERLTRGVPSSEEAQAFLSEYAGHLTISEEPGAYRRSEISGDSYRIVALEAVGKSSDSGLLAHYNKMARD